jgi:hypothetical protein
MDAEKTLTPEEQAKADEQAAQEAFVANIKELMKRYGHKKAWQDASGTVHFDADYVAKKLVGKKLTVIEA